VQFFARAGEIAKVFRRQGDQNGQIFANRAVVYFGHLLKKITEEAQNFELPSSSVQALY
jgi:hypothetical protein